MKNAIATLFKTNTGSDEAGWLVMRRKVYLAQIQFRLHGHETVQWDCWSPLHLYRKVVLLNDIRLYVKNTIIKYMHMIITTSWLWTREKTHKTVTALTAKKQRLAAKRFHVVRMRALLPLALFFCFLFFVLDVTLCFSLQETLQGKSGYIALNEKVRSKYGTINKYGTKTSVHVIFTNNPPLHIPSVSVANWKDTRWSQASYQLQRIEAREVKTGEVLIQ